MEFAFVELAHTGRIGPHILTFRGWASIVAHPPANTGGLG